MLESSCVLSFVVVEEGFRHAPTKRHQHQSKLRHNNNHGSIAFSTKIIPHRTIMATTTSTTRPLSPTTTGDASSSKGNGKSPSSLTGFVLKLYNMVNGAPDDVVSWVPSGEAFRISDLTRLESETLPQYFRHSRFQSLVRQLNFYNFRKINRERTFWVYYHPLFHRDRPEDMPKLRRRTCPGFDGRRNHRENGGKGGGSNSPPPPSASITWSNEDEQVTISHEKGSHEEYKGGGGGQSDGGAMVASPGMGVKVSRSPSPSNSPMDHHNHTFGSLKGTSFKSVVSEEDRSSKKLSRQSSLTSSFSDNGVGFGGHQKDFYRTDSIDSVGYSNMNLQEGYESLKPPSDPLQAEEYVVNQLNHHLGGFATGTIVTKKSRKAKLDRSVSSETEAAADDSSTGHSISSTRKKYSKEELQERQDHLLAVEDVSRRLNGICNDYAASISGFKPRSKKGSRSHLGGGASGLFGQVVRSSSDYPAFGFEKPHDHYYGIGKCDLLTYDCEDGFVIDVDDSGESSSEKKKKNKKNVVVTPTKAVKSKPVAVTTPPSKCPIVNQSLVQACMEGKLVSTASIFERTLASAILGFCLSTHPQDPDLANKIEAHLKKGPMLAKEFELYLVAMTPGAKSTRLAQAEPMATSGELTRYWKMFSMNFMRRVAFLADHEQMQLVMTATENDVIKRFVDVWFHEVY